MHHPFVDGYLFTSAVDCVKGKGVILCWDLRATGEPAKPASGKQMEPKGTTKGRSNAMPLNEDAAPKKKDTPSPNVEIEDLLEF